MKAIIEVDVPDYQIGQEVNIHFKDTMMIKGVVQEPCSDAISRQAVLDLTWELNYPDSSTEEVVSVRDIKELPSVAPKEKTGHWISHYDEGAKEGWYECDRCHTERAFNTKFCPDCGARMESEDKE